MSKILKKVSNLLNPKTVPMTPTTRSKLSNAILFEKETNVENIAKQREIPLSAYKEAENKTSISTTAGNNTTKSEKIAKTLFGKLPFSTQASISMGITNIPGLQGGKRNKRQTKKLRSKRGKNTRKH